MFGTLFKLEYSVNCCCCENSSVHFLPFLVRNLTLNEYKVQETREEQTKMELAKTAVTISIIDCYGKKHKMLDIDILRDHGVQSTLIQSSETSRTMFVAVFNDIGDIHMINTIRFYKGML